MTDTNPESAARSARRRPGRPVGGGPVLGREELVAAAVRVVGELGEAATLDDIASEAGVTKPTLYRVIGDRAALVTALAEWLIDLIYRSTAVGPSAGGSPRDEFRAVIEHLLDTITAQRKLFLFVTAGGHTAELQARLVERAAAGLIAEMSGAGATPGVDPAVAQTWGHGIVGALETSVAMWIRSEYCSADQLADALTRLFWDGLASGLNT